MDTRSHTGVIGNRSESVRCSSRIVVSSSTHHLNKSGASRRRLPVLEEMMAREGRGSSEEAGISEEASPWWWSVSEIMLFHYSHQRPCNGDGDQDGVFSPCLPANYPSPHLLVHLLLQLSSIRR